LPGRPIDKLFAVLLTMYGRHWLDLWTDSPMNRVKETWQAGLVGISDEAIRSAIDYLNKNNKFPPTLPEFITICRQFRPEDRVKLPPPREAHGEIPASISAVLAKRPVGAKRGPDWAHRIMADPASYPHISVAYAREALGLTGTVGADAGPDFPPIDEAEDGYGRENPHEPGEVSGTDGLD
jgi:hypothetical protein